MGAELLDRPFEDETVDQADQPEMLDRRDELGAPATISPSSSRIRSRHSK